MWNFETLKFFLILILKIVTNWPLEWNKSFIQSILHVFQSTHKVKSKSQWEFREKNTKNEFKLDLFSISNVLLCQNEKINIKRQIRNFCLNYHIWIQICCIAKEAWRIKTIENVFSKGTIITWRISNKNECPLALNDDNFLFGFTPVRDFWHE